jgi:hypothetical protein
LQEFWVWLAGVPGVFCRSSGGVLQEFRVWLTKFRAGFPPERCRVLSRISFSALFLVLFLGKHVGRVREGNVVRPDEALGNFGQGLGSFWAASERKFTVFVRVKSLLGDETGGTGSRTCPRSLAAIVVEKAAGGLNILLVYMWRLPDQALEREPR